MCSKGIGLERLLLLLLASKSVALIEATQSSHISLHPVRALVASHLEVLHLSCHWLERLLLLLSWLRLPKSAHHLILHAASWDHAVQGRVLVVGRVGVRVVHLIQVLNVYRLLSHIRWVCSALHVDWLASGAVVALEVSKPTVIIS